MIPGFMGYLITSELTVWSYTSFRHYVLKIGWSEIKVPPPLAHVDGSQCNAYLSGDGTAAVTRT